MFFGVVRRGFGVWEGLQLMGTGCRLQMDGCSDHFEPYGSILEYFHDLGHGGIIFLGLKLE